MIEERLQDILKLAETEETPFYCLDLKRIRKKASDFVSAWMRVFPSGRVAYSYKTNSLRAVTRIMRECGLMAEIVSGAELHWAFSDGFVGEQILFNGPYKSEAELADAIKADVRIQFDSIDELLKILDIATATGANPRLSPRLAIMRDRELSRLGLSVSEYKHAAALAQRQGFRFSGLHFNVGSNNSCSVPYLAALALHKDVIRDLISHSQQPPWIDIGGGLPASSIGQAGIPFHAEDLAKDLATFFARENINSENFILAVEPGRCLTEDFGVLVTRVVALKERARETILIVDAGTNFLRTMSKWYHPVTVVSAGLQQGETKDYKIYGSQCRESDLFGAINGSNSDIKTGDLIIYGNSGAYDIPNSNVWIRSAPAIVGFEENRQVLIRRRETYSEMRSLDACRRVLQS
jgi:diaminopimelate decarboxylase